MINLIAAALTDTGLQRDLNEDRVWSEIYNPSEGESVGLFIVCDGMGGHLGGECASHWAIETIKREMANFFCPKDPRGTVKLSDNEAAAQANSGPVTRKSDITKLENQITNAIQTANDVVHDYAQQKPQEAGDAGTTIALAFVQGGRAVIANVGDSRTYIIRDNQLNQISNDHSLVASLVASGQLQPEEVYSHPQRNVIYRSLGQKQQVQIDTYIQTIRTGNYLLLCSDGLWEMVQDDELIVKLVTTSKDTREACQKLVDEANKAGGEDNIGVVVVKVIG
jgi:protein phosphatase